MIGRSVEARVRRAFWAMLFWRIVGDVLGIPSKLLRAVALVFESIEKSIFYAELESARRYKALTGTDLAYALGETGRYGGLSPERAEQAQARMYEGGNSFLTMLGGEGGDDDDDD